LKKASGLDLALAFERDMSRKSADERRLMAQDHSKQNTKGRKIGKDIY